MAVAALPEHDNIVGQFRAWQQEGHFYIQMDLCEGGSLAHLLEEVGVTWRKLVAGQFRSDKPDELCCIGEPCP